MTSSKNKILVVLPFMPYPMESGGHQALYNGLMAIKGDMEVTVTFPAVDNASFKANYAKLQQLMPEVTFRPLLKAPEGKPTIKQRVYYHLHRIGSEIGLFAKPSPQPKDVRYLNSWKADVTPKEPALSNHVHDLCCATHYDIVQVEMPWFIPFVFVLPEDVKRVHVHHELGFVRRELESKQLDKYSAHAESLRKFADFNEIGQLNMYDSIITLSPIDTQKLKDKGVVKPVYSSFAIIDAAPLENTVIGDGKRLTFIGPDQHNPNFLGITWFLENCWSRLKSLDPEMTLDIIGKWSEDHKQEYAAKYPGVRFLGFVDDLNAAIQGSTMIVPITVGSGIRMKILEASSKGVPFVSTTVGAEGIPVTDGKDCFLTDDPDTFVQDILKLQNQTLRQQFITNAHEMVKSHYSLEALRKNRMEIYNKVL